MQNSRKFPEKHTCNFPVELRTLPQHLASNEYVRTETHSSQKLHNCWCRTVPTSQFTRIKSRKFPSLPKSYNLNACIELAKHYDATFLTKFLSQQYNFPVSLWNVNMCLTLCGKYFITYHNQINHLCWEGLRIWVMWRAKKRSLMIWAWTKLWK